MVGWLVGIVNVRRRNAFIEIEIVSFGSFRFDSIRFGCVGVAAAVVLDVLLLFLNDDDAKTEHSKTNGTQGCKLHDQPYNRAHIFIPSIHIHPSAHSHTHAHTPAYPVGHGFWGYHT